MPDTVGSITASGYFRAEPPAPPLAPPMPEPAAPSPETGNGSLNSNPEAAPAPPSPPTGANVCVICFSEPVSMGFLHGASIHTCACEGCAQRVGEGTRCPMCQVPVERVVRAFVDYVEADPSTASAAIAGSPPATDSASVLMGHGKDVVCLAFSPDGKWLASGSEDRSVRIWNAADGSLYKALSHKSRVTGVAFSADGALLVSACEEGTLRVFEATTFQPTGVVFDKHGSSVNCCALTQLDGQNVCLSGGNAAKLMSWNPDTGESLADFNGHTGHVHSVAICQDGHTAVSSGMDKAVRVWDIPSGAQKHVLTGHTGMPCIVFAVAALPLPGSTLFVSCGSDKAVRLWDWATGQSKGELPRQHTDWVRSAAFSPDGALCLTGGSDKVVRVWDMRTRSLADARPGLHSNMVSAVAISKDHHFATGSAGPQNNLRLWRNHAS